MPAAPSQPREPNVRRLPRAMREFVDTEAAGGIALVVAAVVALVWANSPWQASYRTLWTTDLSIRLGSHVLALDLRHWVNDGLMAVFFFVVGLELKREVVLGELRDRRRVGAPVLAAIGGMVVPALLYFAANAGGAGSHGWAIPMATDIAFALGVVALLGPRVPPPLKVFLLTLAVVDDLGAIVVIALFYSSSIDGVPLLVAVVLLAVGVVLQRLEVRWLPIYLLLAGGVWLAVHESGVHATIAGVALGLLAPTSAAFDHEVVEARAGELADVSTTTAARASARIARLSVSAVEWYEHGLHPWTSFVVVPLFALANAGVPLGSDALRDAAGSPVTIGVVVGLVVGKPLGITLGTWLATRLRIGTPPGTSWREVVGIGAVAGIGFTVSLFVTGLAFDPPALQDDARVGVLAAAVLAGACGAAVLSVSRRGVAGTNGARATAKHQRKAPS